jgi:signal transduction histidine kinase
VYSIVEDHGGVIQVDSELGRGTAFHIYLPTSPNHSE